VIGCHALDKAAEAQKAVEEFHKLFNAGEFDWTHDATMCDNICLAAPQRTNRMIFSQTLALLAALAFTTTSFAAEVPTWAQMQQAVMPQPNPAKIRELVQSGVDPNAPIGCGTFAPLNGAIYMQNSEAVELLLSLGAKPTDRQIVAAAFCANLDAALKIVKALHQAGASVNAWSYYGRGQEEREFQPIHWAVIRENKDLVAYLLLQKGIELDNLDIDGKTPLMIAVEKGNEELVGMLLDAGANPSIKNGEGIDAAAIASRRIKAFERIEKWVKSQGRSAE